MSGLLGMPKVFVSSNRSSYTIEFVADGPWVDESGEICRLMTLNAAGNPLRFVLVGTEAAGDVEAIVNFGLLPWAQAKVIDRRRASERRQNSERRRGDRRNTDQPSSAMAETEG
jgi:hypothetical protein